MLSRGRLRHGLGGFLPVLGAAGLAILIATWSRGFNVNLFYLTYLGCTYLAAIILLRPVKARIAALGGLMFFAFYAPDPAPPLPPEPITFKTGTIVPPGTSRSYRFMTAVLRERQADCGSLRRGEVHIQGESLVAGLRGDHGSISDQQIRPFYIMQRLDAALDLSPEIPKEFRLSLDNGSSAALTIFRGPEISGRDLYPDAVYLIFRNERCVVVLHGNALEDLR
jgi:hypothetical protein